MKYKVIIRPSADEDLKSLKKSEPVHFRKVGQFLSELEDHPKTGTGHPKPLGGDRVGQWSRRISDKHRLIYEIMDEIVVVLVLSAYGHYDDK